MALIGNHKINYRVPGNSNLKNLHFGALLKFDEVQYNFVKRFGTDTWLLNIGEILSAMIQELNKSEENAPAVIHLHGLEVVHFKKGLIQWSTHTIKIKLDYSVSVNETVVISNSVTGEGSGSGTEFGAITYIPILGNMNFDKGIEIAVYRSLEKCLFAIYEETKSAYTKR